MGNLDRELTALERQRRALKLRSAGVEFHEIAKELGYKGPSGAAKAVKSALIKTLRPPADELREMLFYQYSTMLKALWPSVLRGDPKAITAAIAVLSKIAALYGLDAPTRSEVTGKNGGPLEVIFKEVERDPGND